MLTKNHPKFDEMDALSVQKRPFFFMVDFLMEEVLIFGPEELAQEKVKVLFPSFSTHPPSQVAKKAFHWKVFPQSMQAYEKGFQLIQSHLQRGDSYVVNYTCETAIETNLSLEEIFQWSQAKYKVLLPNRFSFFSPETFVEIKNQKIYTHPMKGTIDASIPQAKEKLKNDPKEKAEHYTVVDLLRNDLSMVANNVVVDEFQRIDYLQTNQKNLYAMSSEISGKVKPEFQNKIGTILKTLLPAGSILGAPKAKTLEIILSAEIHSRGFYTGVAGYFDGENLDSCVMIRFVENKSQEKGQEQLFFKSGGGITHLSPLESEYQEMKNKIYVPIH